MPAKVARTKNSEYIEVLFPFNVDVSKDHSLFNERLQKALALKRSPNYSLLTKIEKTLVDEQIKCLESLIDILKKRMALY